MRSRMVTLMLAVLTGAVAVAIVYLYVQRVEEETARGQQLISVLVAGENLPRNTTWADIVGRQLADVREIPEAYAAPGVLSSSEDLPPGRVLAHDVVTGEQLTSQAFAANAEKAFGLQIEAGNSVFALPVERVRGIAGHVASGSRLNAYETRDQGGTELIARRVQVVELRPAAEGDPAGLDTMVLQGTHDQAVALINAQEQASLWFTLAPQRNPS